MDRALSFLISAGIAAFGVWIIAYTIASGSPLVWTLLGILPVVVGLISFIRQSVEASLALEYLGCFRPGYSGAIDRLSRLGAHVKIVPTAL